jgi:hypothetical protein
MEMNIMIRNKNNERTLYRVSFEISLTIDGIPVRAMARKASYFHYVDLLEPFRATACGAHLNSSAGYNWRSFVETDSYRDSESLVRRAYIAWRDMQANLPELQEQYRLFLPRIQSCMAESERLKAVCRQAIKGREASWKAGLITHQEYRSATSGLEHEIQRLDWRCDILHAEWFDSHGLKEAASLFGEGKVRELVVFSGLMQDAFCTGRNSLS